jgi:hypothetical protein
MQPDAWSDTIYVTRDFEETVNLNYIYGDNFLRPAKWLAFRVSKPQVCIFLSGFEANHLKYDFNENLVALAMLMPRKREEQEMFYTKGKIEKIPGFIIAQCAQFAGSVYFRSIDEQEALLRFAGYSPTPRTLIEKRYFDEGKINRNGYISKEFRKEIFQDDYEISMFENDPSEALVKMADIRHYGRVSKFSHHSIVFLSGRRPLVLKLV